MNTTLRAAVVGSTGYGGVELIRFLSGHPKVQITSVISSSSSGERLSDGFPHLTEIITDTLDGVDIPLIREKADVVFTATPHGVSAKLVPQLLEAGLKVIDLSGDFRLKDGAVYEKWYKHAPADEALLAQAVYGLSEVFGDQVEGLDFVSNPGCYPTATLLMPNRVYLVQVEEQALQHTMPKLMRISKLTKSTNINIHQKLNKS